LVKVKKTLLATIALSTLILAGCGAATSNNSAGAAPTTVPTQTTNQAVSNTSSSASNASQTSDASTTALKAQEIDLTVYPGSRLGPDGKMHDTYAQTDLNVIEGVPVKLTVYNYDSGEHSVTAPGLNVNLQATGSTKEGVPGVTTVTFTPTKTGNFDWQCIDKCDGGMTSYAMTHDGYMKGTIHVLPQSTIKQYIDLSIKDGVHYASADGKLHDSYSPADFTVQAGIPVVVTVTNFDTGDHSMYSADLGLNQVMKGASKEGVPTVTTFTFTPTKTGSFKWQCTIKCDGGMSSYAMTHDGYMMGTINVVG
jgi:heme/copper-type cytochrome/quinol oxidase subunit 2